MKSLNNLKQCYVIKIAPPLYQMYLEKEIFTYITYGRERLHTEHKAEKDEH